MVACTGFEPVNAALRGRCVKPLHQQAVCNYVSTLYFKKQVFLMQQR